jgi:hypothetical protein
MNRFWQHWQPGLILPHPRKSPSIFWLTLSITFSAMYALMVLQKAFKGEYVIQDDARQHIFWMERFIDAELFPNDLIADYFQSVAPVGYTTFYKIFAAFGIHPLLLSKIIPPILGILTTIYCFGVTMEILPVPFAGFMASVILNQSIWMKFDVVSATPRAFIYPFFIIFIYYVLRRQLMGTCIAIALLGLFYPQLILICCPVLVFRLIRWQHILQPAQWSTPKLLFSKKLLQPVSKPEYLLSLIPFIMGILVLFIYAIKPQIYGAAIAASQAMNMPEFLPGGRTPFFNQNPVQFWLIGELSGFFPPLLPPLIWLGLCLPLVLKNPTHFPLVRKVNRNIRLLLDIIIASVAMFFAAHAVLFRLYLPSRYMEHSCRVVLAIATGLLITVIVDAACQQIPSPGKNSKKWAIVSILLISLTIFYPLYDRSFPRTNYRPGQLAPLYEFFQQQPKDILIASLASEANNLPTFAKRSVLVAPEYAISFHMGYYQEFSQRTRDLIRAQYTPHLEEMQQFIQKYGIDFWLLERSAFTTDYLVKNDWLQQYQSAATEAIAQLDLESPAAVANFIEPCAALKTGDFVVLNTECMLNSQL